MEKLTEDEASFLMTCLEVAGKKFRANADELKLGNPKSALAGAFVLQAEEAERLRSKLFGAEISYKAVVEEAPPPPPYDADDILRAFHQARSQQPTLVDGPMTNVRVVAQEGAVYVVSDEEECLEVEFKEDGTYGFVASL